jgi:hypothetical protein
MPSNPSAGELLAMTDEQFEAWATEQWDRKAPRFSIGNRKEAMQRLRALRTPRDGSTEALARASRLVDTICGEWPSGLPVGPSARTVTAMVCDTTGEPIRLPLADLVRLPEDQRPTDT